MATDANGLNTKDANQVIRAQALDLSDGTTAQRSVNVASLISEPYDFIQLTYVTAGNGIGEIETVVYKQGGSGGTTVATLTLTYDANDNLETITRS